MSPLDLILEPLGYAFLTRALLATLIAAVTCALLSCWLVQLGWSLMGDAVSHAVLPGVVLAYLVGLPFALGALVFGVGAVALIGGLQTRTRLRSDAVIGVVFTALFALGLVLVSVTPSQTDLGHILFGNVLGVGADDLAQIAVIGAVTATVLLALRRDLTLLAFDAAHAHALGLPVRALRATLLGLLALTVVTALQTVGVILVVALLVIPGSTALLVSRRMRGVLTVAVASGVVSAVVGVYAAFWLDVSPGGAVVLTEALLFAVAVVVGRRGPRLRDRPSTRTADSLDTDDAETSTPSRP